MSSRILVHPVLKDRVTVMVTPEDSAGALLRIEYDARAVTPPADDHVHPEQEERIEVLAGTLHCRVGGEVREMHAGETLIIPPRTPHALWNETPTGSRTVGEYRPALATLELFEAIFVAAPGAGGDGRE
jgi:quercetin dioxygenase-like cupin family protein